MVKARLARALVIGGLLLGAAGVALAPAPAAARVHVGIGFGFPLFGPPAPAYYYPPPYYYAPPPPAYYAPPPGYYAPPPASYAPPATYYAPPAAPSATSGQCREYSSTMTISGRQQQVTGTACLQPDGTWRLVD